MWRKTVYAGAVAALLLGGPSLAAAQPYGGYDRGSPWDNQAYGCDGGDCAADACDQDEADCDAARGDDGYFACDAAGDDCDQVSRYDGRRYDERRYDSGRYDGDRDEDADYDDD
jgi:hypothetical protein